MLLKNDEFYMAMAMELAREAAAEGETPVGAVVVRNDGFIAGRGRNCREKDRNALCHAEVIAIDEACRTLGGWRLLGCTIYVTLEPCPMCAGAIINSRLDRVVFGAADSAAGSAGSLVNLFQLGYNHSPEVVQGIMKDESEALLKDFFSALRRKRKMQRIKLVEVKTEQQIEAAAALADEIWHEWFPSILSAEQIDYMVDKFQSVREMTEQLENGYTYYILRKGDARLGYTAIRPDPDGRLFLSKIYIKKEYRGNGYAREVFAFLKDYCREHGLGAIWLTVNKHNDSSIAVYKKSGFRIIGEDVTDIGNGYVMDDYFFQLDID